VPKAGGVKLRKLAIRLQHLKQREEFRFDTTNKDAAANQARDVFRFLKANGWQATLAKYKPESQETPKANVTLGEYLTAVDSLRRLRPRTFSLYRRAIRTVVAGAFNVQEQKGFSKFDYRGEDSGHAQWVAKVDSRRLSDLTEDRITKWKRQRIADAGSAPNAAASARRTVNSYIRCARSLFAKGVVKELSGLQLPDPLPFQGVELEKAGSMEYQSKINAQTLITAARKELKKAEPEAYKAFLLGMFAGMRKAEIDLAEWGMLDFARNVIHLQQTEWLHLKSEDSAGEIQVDPEVMIELREFMPKPTARRVRWSQFILKSERPPRAESATQYYRCEPTFKKLSDWLRKKGVKANKPMHELRKELGALIATQHGIYAASRFLRHADISTTARHYADQKARVSVGLGDFLQTEIKPVDAKARKLVEQLKKLSPEDRAAVLASLNSTTTQAAVA
jgi:integrase